MNRHIIIFLVTFAVGAVFAVILRTALHRPYAGEKGPPTVPAAAMPAPAPHDHGAATMTPSAPATAAATVNSTCAICGMPVNPAFGTALYKGKLVGFGCKTCPPKFKAEPEKYGEAALTNQVVE